ncbi:MAG TPA: delta-60 repeat domain-containing protein [Casimicrobium sp.]|nr:delta-60 repeat domain-containing protein [Casimicrobium sp.]
MNVNPLVGRVVAALALVSACYAPLVNATPGQPGTLDASWGTLSPLGAGKVSTDIGSRDDSAAAMTRQPDSKVLLAGTCYDGTNNDFCVARYTPNGTLDTSWNGTGKVITAIGSGSDTASAMTLQPDGKVLLAGKCDNNSGYYEFCATRYNANGTLDLTWNGTGQVMTTINGAWDSAQAITLQPDGKVLLAGTCYIGPGSDFCAARYNLNGTLDTTWNGTGKVITDIGIVLSSAAAIAVQPDGKVLLAGYCYNGGNNDFCATRYNANGTLDTTWNGTGRVITAMGGGDGTASAMTLQPDGKVLLAGTCSSDFCAARYNANGSLDTSWNGTGKLLSAIGSGYDSAGAITLQPDGKVLLAGYCYNGTNNDFCAARYNSNGTLDTTWNSTGKVITAIGSSDDTSTAMTLQPDGRVLLAGNCRNGTYTEFCVARYDGGPFGYQNCKLDIDGDGSVLATTDMLIGNRVALGITGSAVVNGVAFPPTATRNTWPLIRDYLVTQCGMSLQQ